METCFGGFQSLRLHGLVFWGNSFFVLVWGGGDNLKGGDTKAHDLRRQPPASGTIGAPRKPL